jgi:hypothetical protein
VTSGLSVNTNASFGPAPVATAPPLLLGAGRDHSQHYPAYHWVHRENRYVWTIGIIVLVASAILALLGMMGHAVGGRRHYF